MQWQIESQKRGTYPPLKFVQRVVLHGYDRGLHLLYHAHVHDLVHHDEVHLDHGRDCALHDHEHGFHAHVGFHLDALAKPSSQDYAMILIELCLRWMSMIM